MGRADGTGTYRCYALIDDGSREKRLERSLLLEDNCSINGIIDWKLDLFTLKVFAYFSVSDDIADKIYNVIEKNYVSLETTCKKDTKKIEAEITAIKKKLTVLLDALVAEVVSEEDYKIKKLELDEQLELKQAELENANDIIDSSQEKEQVLVGVKKFLKESIDFPIAVKNGVSQVPEILIESYVNSIKACANNVFEYNMRINPNAKIQQPLVVPDEEFIASVHPATNILDNSNAVLLGEFEVDYDMAKSYANSLKRKVLRVHWKTPAKIKIYVNIV